MPSIKAIEAHLPVVDVVRSAEVFAMVLGFEISALWSQQASEFAIIKRSTAGVKAMETTVNNAETVRAIYDAFGRGDVATILGKLDDNVEWETTVPVPGMPWLQAQRGKVNLNRFFECLAPLTITRFEPHTIFDAGDKMFVLIRFEATAWGRDYSFLNSGHLRQFNATGNVVKYDHVTDTAQMIRMA